MSKREALKAIGGNLMESIGVFPGADQAAAPVAAPRVGNPRDAALTHRAKNIWDLPLDQVAPDPDQPRKEFDPEALDRLAASLREKGQLQPIQVRWDATMERFVVLVGERRWRAAGLAGLDRIRAVVREETLEDGERLALQLVENCLREDLKPVEQARAYRTLMDARGWTAERLAEELSVAKSNVAKSLALLELPATIQAHVDQGELAPSTAYEITRLDDPADQIRLAETAVGQKLTRSDVVKQVKAAPRKKASRRVQAAVVYRLGGYKITLERKAGVEWESAVAALLEAVERIKDAAGQGRAEQAA